VTYPAASSEGMLKDQLLVRVMVSDANSLPSQPASEILNHCRLAASTPSHPPRGEPEIRTRDIADLLLGQAAMYSMTGPKGQHIHLSSMHGGLPRCPQSQESQLALMVAPARTSQVWTSLPADIPPQATIGE
jgi:hypothetical protein